MWTLWLSIKGNLLCLVKFVMSIYRIKRTESYTVISAAGGRSTKDL